jgi:DNA (cytosine-5)-methyltransferase 1
MIPVWPAEVAPTLNAAFGTKQGLEDQHALGGAGCFVPALPIAVETDCYNGSITGDVACTMGTPGSSVNASGPTVMQPVVTFGGDIARTLQARHDSSPCADRGMDVVATAMQVRRLTPVECERLQGFPDGYTDIKPRGKDTPDGPRYKALGNSMAVPVMRWIGERIEAVDKLPR